MHGVLSGEDASGLRRLEGNSLVDEQGSLARETSKMREPGERGGGGGGGYKGNGGGYNSSSCQSQPRAVHEQNVGSHTRKLKAFGWAGCYLAYNVSAEDLHYCHGLRCIVLLSISALRLTPLKLKLC